jgi:4-hydroxy-3-methylbut-2-enyl diphosphate reductase
MEVARYSKKGAEVVLIGHEGHVEVIGTMGQYQNPEGTIYLVESIEDVEKLLLRDPKNCMYATQTTLSVTDTQAIIEALQKKFPDIEGPKKEDICYATQNRQDAVRLLTEHVDLILVVGSKNSSNSNRLRELAEQRGKPGFLIDSYEDIQMSWFDGVQRVGITAGASAPESLVEGVVQFLKDTFDVTDISKLTGIEENVHFTLPKDLRDVPLEKAFI